MPNLFITWAPRFPGSQDEGFNNTGLALRPSSQRIQERGLGVGRDLRLMGRLKSAWCLPGNRHIDDQDDIRTRKEKVGLE